MGIRFAVVGLGRIGKRHIETIGNIREAEVAAVCDVAKPDDETLQGIPFFHSLTDLLSSQINIDAVCVCTPNGLHANQALQILESGKHIVVEKPLAITSAEANKILAVAKQRNLQVFCVLQCRFSRPIQWLKQMIDEKRLGRINLIQINCFWNRDSRYYTNESWHGTAQLDGGTLFTQFTHYIDTLLWLFGNIAAIRGNFTSFANKNIDFEDTGIFQFTTANGTLGSFSYTTAAYEKNFESSLTVLAERGSVRISGQYMENLDLCNVQDREPPTFSRKKSPGELHTMFLQQAVNSLQNGTFNHENILSAIKVVETIERIYQVRDKQWKK